MTDLSVSSIQEAKEGLASLTAKMAEFEKTLQEQASELFKNESAWLFEKYPDLKSFSWTQYTPYFNDGETCEFSVHYEYDLAVNGIDEYGEMRYDDEDEDGKMDEDEAGSFYDQLRRETYVEKPNPKYDPSIAGQYRNGYVPWTAPEEHREGAKKTIMVKEPNPNFNPEIRKMFDEVLTFLKQFKDDHFKQMFGDHCRVKVTSSGVTVEDYEHE